jgi:UDPglucose--hexose-1-phosphate uridylyltransferase
VVIAPGRAKRPGAAAAGVIEPPSEEVLASCPFDAGREDRAPPETLRLPAEGPWRVRVVPNLYPALDRQEVVVHSARHARSLAELDNDELGLVATAWRLRREAVPEGYLFACVNEGRSAGASLAHSHSQLVWLRDTPPVVAVESALERLLEGAPVTAVDGVTAVCPTAARAPYETTIAPVDPERDAFTSGRLAPALRLLGAFVRRLQELEGPVPFNAWLHTGASWHLHVVPRLTVPAGLELGAGIDINPLPPEEAAERLSGLSP